MGVPVEQLAQETASKARNLQIRPALREAIRLYVTEGLSKTDAALRAGMTLHGLLAALKKPHVRAFEVHVKAAWMDSRTSKAWLNVADLADSAQSEDVRLKANRVFLEAAGELGGKGEDPSKVARTLVQIIIGASQNQGQLRDDQLSGVIEAPAWRAIGHDTSNSAPVGRLESEEPDDDAE